MIEQNAESIIEGNKTLLEQYKIFVEMSDRISQRRLETNKFFITIHTFIISLATLFGNTNYIVLMFVSVIGVMFSISWFFLLLKYKQLNSGKFKVILEIERKLPFAPFKKEWDILASGRDGKKYLRLTNIESVLPVLFGVLYFVLAIYIWCHQGSVINYSTVVQNTPTPVA